MGLPLTELGAVETKYGSVAELHWMISVSQARRVGILQNSTTPLGLRGITPSPSAVTCLGRR